MSASVSTAAEMCYCHHHSDTAGQWTLVLLLIMITGSCLTLLDRAL